MDVELVTTQRRPEPGAEAAAEQELQLRSLPEHLQPKRSKCLAAAKAGAAKKNPSVKRTGGQSAEAEPARSGRKQALRATVAGAAAEAEEGRSRSRLPGRERSSSRAGRAICHGSGRRKLDVELAERQLPAGANGQVAWRRNQSEPAPVRAGGAE